MKKVFLLFGIAAFSAATAQQKDLFDIQKHIENNQSKKNNAAEKQKITLPYFKNLQPAFPFAVNQHNLSYRLSNGDVVVYGNGTMPCIKADINQFQTMPNIAFNNQFSFNFFPAKILPGQIPNGSFRYNTISSD